MDEIWQRHKTFILQVAVGGLAFLIALLVMSNAYSGGDDPEEIRRINKGKKDTLEKAVREKRAPSPTSITAQRERASQAEREIREMAAMCASLAEGDEYVRENITWVLANVGRPASDVAKFFTMYKDSGLPQTCLTSLREEARAELVKRASQDRVMIEESLGITGAPADDEVPAALHGLALVTDVIRRALEVNATLDPDGRKKVAAVRELRDADPALRLRVLPRLLGAASRSVQVSVSPRSRGRTIDRLISDVAGVVDPPLPSVARRRRCLP